MCEVPDDEELDKTEVFVNDDNSNSRHGLLQTTTAHLKVKSLETYQNTSVAKKLHFDFAGSASRLESMIDRLPETEPNLEGELFK